ncbi:MAG: hypothetical protein EOP84_23315 [Verrucomicrobiaceae bacterium]|nr:MAG: hypothetical protein EOP84_23315 [Verrucomicrobiaceae bacterium]
MDFKAGWNMIGIPTGTTAPLTEPVNLLSVLTKAGFDYDTILRWESSTQTYKQYSTTNNRNTTSQEIIPVDPNAGIMAIPMSAYLTYPGPYPGASADLTQGHFLGLSASPTLNHADPTWYFVFSDGKTRPL